MIKVLTAKTKIGIEKYLNEVEVKNVLSFRDDGKTFTAVVEVK